MTERKTLFLVHKTARLLASNHCMEMPDGWSVTFAPPKRSLEANAKFHAICSDLARSGFPWAGKPRTAEQWKVLLVSGHATATKEGAEMIPGIEGEFVNIRESTALMSVRRSSSLIDYATAFAVQNGVQLRAEEEA